MKFCRRQLIVAGCAALLAVGLVLPFSAQPIPASVEAQLKILAEQKDKMATVVHAWDFIPEHAPLVVTFHPNKFFAHEIYTNMQEYVKKNEDPLARRAFVEANVTEDDILHLEMAAFQPNYSTEFADDRVKVDGEAVVIMPNVERYFQLFSKYAAEYKYEIINSEGRRGFHKAYVYENPETKEKTTTHILFEFVSKDQLIVRTATNRDIPPWKQWTQGAKNPLLSRLKPASDVLTIGFDMTSMPKEHSQKNEKLDEVSEYLEKVYIRFYQSAKDKYMASMVMSCFDTKSCKALKLLVDAFLLLTSDPEEDAEHPETHEDKGFAMKKCTTFQFLRALRYGSNKNDLIFQLKMTDELLKKEFAEFYKQQTENRQKALNKKPQDDKKSAKK